MKIKALRSFCGKVSMIPGEVREVAEEIAKDLIRAGHAVEVEAEKGKKGDSKEEAPAPKPEEKPVENPAEAPAEEPAEEKKTSKKSK